MLRPLFDGEISIYQAIGRLRLDNFYIYYYESQMYLFPNCEHDATERNKLDRFVNAMVTELLKDSLRTGQLIWGKPK